MPATWGLIRPVHNPPVASPREREHAERLLSEFGSSSYGYFKTSPDKSKDRFEPDWEDRFLVYDHSLLALPKIGLAMTRSL